MSEHLLIDPNLLYKVYSFKDIDEYYPFNFFPVFKSIEIDIFYDILNTLPSKDITTIYQYLMKQWRVMCIHINDYDAPDKKVQRNKNSMLRRRIDPVHHVLHKDEFNSRMNKFIKNNKTISLMVMNIINRYLYP